MSQGGQMQPHIRRFTWLYHWSFMWKTSVMPYTKPTLTKSCKFGWWRGVNHLLTMCMLNLIFKILAEILVCHTGGVNHLLTMCMLSLIFKILGEILVCHTGGSIIFWTWECWILSLKLEENGSLSYYWILPTQCLEIWCPREQYYELFLPRSLSY